MDHGTLAIFTLGHLLPHSAADASGDYSPLPERYTALSDTLGTERACARNLLHFILPDCYAYSMNPSALHSAHQWSTSPPGLFHLK